jgi:hypothetical protein
MRNLRTRVSALALAVVFASGMATVFSTPVSAANGSFGPPTNDEVCASLASAEEALVNVANPIQKAVLQKLIDAAQARLGCE